jgi:serine/threonine protein kinase
MAPEVARGEAHSAALDVWSFGCLLVHMTTLRPPYYALKCKTAMDIVRVVQRGEVSPVQVLIDDTDRREYKCPASILALAKQCCRRDPEQRPDMPAIADAIASPGIQNGILKGARDMRPLVRLQRRRVLAPVAVDSQGTYDASHGTYGASKSILGGSLALSPRADAAPSPRVSSSSTKSKFRRMSKQTSAAAGFVSTYDGTFDDAASSSTCDANKASTSTFVGNSPTLTRTMDMTDSIDLALTLPRSSKTPFVTTFERPGRMTSLRAGCDSARLPSVPSPRAGGDDVLTSTYEASKYVASSST